MLFNSLNFLVFFPIVCLFYYIIPHRIRHIFLLICSYYFYMCWNAKYALLMLLSTIVTYCSGLLIDAADKIADETARVCRKKLYVALSFVINLSILFFFKYFGFATHTVERIFSLFHVSVTFPTFDVILPVGISFYTFQALSYTMDVYRKEIYAEHDFLKYALFVSFFPQLVAGPIERSKNLLVQINREHHFDWDRVKDGLLLMLYGYFQKVVLAEYLGNAVDAVYGQYDLCTGFQLTTATIFFAFQIYCDFGSYSNIAIGAAKVMGFELMENFNTPYFAQTVADFWRRWHISLSSWFRDYLYIPLGGNRKGRLRKQLNIMIVFTVSGLWHGASWHFVIWGALNGAYQVLGEWLRPVKEKCVQLFHIDCEAASHHLLRIICTFSLINISWVFFRAESFKKALDILSICLGMHGGEWFTYGTNISTFGLTPTSLNVLIISMLALLAADFLKYQHIVVRQWILKQGLWLRWIIIYSAMFFILIFGKYGPEFDASQFIYFQF